MKKFCFSLICFVVLLFVGFSTYYIVRNNETIAYTISDNETIYMNLGESIDSPVIHKNKAKGTEIKLTLSGSSVTFDAETNTFHANKSGSTTIACVPTNTNFPSRSFTIAVGDGSYSNPYYIRNEEDLRKIGQGDWLLSSNYELISDISLTKDFQPIGDENSAFIGSIFGGEAMYTISNINIASSSKTAGFFGNIGEFGKVERIRFKNVNIVGDYQYAGGIAGINNGFIGQCAVENAKIINSSSKGYTGGIVGQNKTIAGNAQLSLCTFDGSIDARNFVGGIAGANQGGMVDNSKTTLDIELSSTSSTFGGIVGSSTYATIPSDNQTRYSNAKYINVVAITNKFGTRGNYYTLIGESQVLANEDATQTYYDMVVTCTSSIYLPVGNSEGDTKLIGNTATSVCYYANFTPEQLTDASNFTKPAGSTWDFSNSDGKEPVWVADDNVVYINYTNTSYPELPAGASGEIKEIKSESAILNALELLRQYPSANFAFKVVAYERVRNGQVIRVDRFDVDYEGQTINPIGSESNPFVGKFIVDEGVTLTISNYVISSDSQYSGFFGVIKGRDTLIKNVTFSYGEYSGDIIGGIAGLNDGATIDNCIVSDFNINAGRILGAIAGVNKGTIIGGVNTPITNEDSGEISYENISSVSEGFFTINDIPSNELVIGMAVGENIGNIQKVESSLITINFVTDSDKPVFVGGLVGRQTSGLIDTCDSLNMTINAPNLTGSAIAGGLVAYLDGGRVYNSYASSAITLTTTRDTFVGGVAGFVGINGEVELCVYKGKATAKNVGGVVGTLYGRLLRSAVDLNAELIGENVGGLVYDCRGIIRNSYSLATLRGTSIQAGFVTYLNEGSSVRYSYSYCAFLGNGKGYCETVTEFRKSKGNREFTRNIVVGVNVGENILFGDSFVTEVIQRDGEKKVAIQTNSLASKGSYTVVSQDDVTYQGQLDAFENAGFDKNIWDFEPDVQYMKDYFAIIGLPEPLSDDVNPENPGENTPENPGEITLPEVQG